MNRFVLGSLALAFPALFSTGVAEAKSKKDEAHLRYAPTYSGAFSDAKARNTVVFLTFHKDK